MIDNVQAVVPVSFRSLVLYETCVEVWPSPHLKVTYTASILVLAAVIPVVVVATVHTRIATHLYHHAHTRNHHDERWVQREIERNRRTTLLLSGEMSVKLNTLVIYPFKVLYYLLFYLSVKAIVMIWANMSG